MTSDLTIINPLTHPGWDDLLLSHPDHSFFHSSCWARVLHDSYGYQPLYFGVLDRGKLTACVPVMEIRSFLTGTRGVSLPFTDYCYPLASSGFDLKEAFASIAKYGEGAGWLSLELRAGETLPQDWPCSSYYYGHTLDLPEDDDRLIANIKDSTQRNIRKADRLGLSVDMSTTRDSLEEFYRLNCLTRKAHGLPPQPVSFFRNVQDHVIAKGHGVVALARHEGRAIAGAVYFHFGQKALYKYGASERRHLSMRPNDLVMWEAILWHRSKGFTTLCLGRTEPENGGLRAFKKGWGTEEKVIRYAWYDLKTKNFVAGNPAKNALCTAVMKRLPVPFLKQVGKALYRHVG